jgi:hypothetical protein
MLVHTASGNTFAFEEVRDWLQAAGFAEIRMLQAPAPSPLILARRRD